MDICETPATPAQAEQLPLAARMAMVSLRISQAVGADKDMVVKVKRSELKQLADAFVTFELLHSGRDDNGIVAKQLRRLMWSYLVRCIGFRIRKSSH